MVNISVCVLNVVAFLTTNMIVQNMSHCRYNIMYSFSRVQVLHSINTGLIEDNDIQSSASHGQHTTNI